MAGPTPKHYREVMAHVPTSVAIVAGLIDGKSAGLSVGTFVPVSLEPPLIGFFVARTSKSWPTIHGGGAFCVSVLGDDQEEISARFAVSDTDKFAGVEWRLAPSGQPVVAGSVAWVDCEIDRIIEAGDHIFVLGRVLDMGLEAGQPPLVHHRSAYRRVADSPPV